MLGPEVWMPENEGRPYCPFRHDVYQLGKTMQWEFPVGEVDLKHDRGDVELFLSLSFLLHQGLARAYPAFDTTIKAMVDVKPENRPNMSQVMHSMKTFLTSLTDQDLQVNGYQTGTAGSWLPQHKAFFEGFGDWMHR